MHIPDLMVGKQNGLYVVTLNMEFIPQLKMVSRYSANIKAAGTARDKQFMVNALKEARWFLKALEIRNQHLLQTAEAIVCHQHPFLEWGTKAIVPLHYHHIASDTGLHESTISRLVCNKLILTPQGLFELKSFFGNGTQPLQAMIKQLVAEEPPGDPLSDKQMTQLLLNRGFTTTRRTVAKYREAMDIPSSYHRKKRGITYGNSNNRS
jgi:RNA polymerase sigma-54 factor